jgi:hypothetical protein
MGNTVRRGNAAQLQGLLQRVRAIIDAREQVAVEVDHVWTLNIKGVMVSFDVLLESLLH